MASEPMPVIEMRRLFRKYDDDNDGAIGVDELKKVMCASCNERISELEFDRLVRLIDKNHDMKIQYDEFVNAIYFNPLETRETQRHRILSTEAVRVVYFLWQGIKRETQPGGHVDRSLLINALSSSSPVMKEVYRRIEVFRDDDVDEEMTVVRRLTSPACRSRFEGLPEMVDQKTLVKAVWPKLPENDVKWSLRYMSFCLAGENLGKIVEAVLAETELDLKPDAIKFTLEELDRDDDGFLTIKDMVKGGVVSLEKALEVSERLDRSKQDGYLSLKELMTALTEHTNNDFSASMAGLFAGRVQTF